MPGIEAAIALGEKTAKERADQKDAARVAAMTTEERAAEEAKKATEAAAAKDTELLSKKDEELDDVGRARKSEILKAQSDAQKAEEDRILGAKDEELSDEDRSKKAAVIAKRDQAKKDEWQKSVDYRIAEVKKELDGERASRKKDLEQIKALEEELAGLKGQKGLSEDELDTREETRIKEYAEKDKALPREKRREMSDEELQEFLIEDMLGAQRWLARQEIRRQNERQKDITEVSDSGVRAKAEAIIKKQQESKVRATAAHPKAIETINRVTRRALELSKTMDQKAVKSTLLKEIPEAQAVLDALTDEALAYEEDGPERLARAVEEGMKKTKPSETQEERDDRIRQEAAAAEQQRISNLPPHLRPGHKDPASDGLTDLEKAQYNVFKSQFPNKTLQDFKDMQKRRKDRAGG